MRVAFLITGIPRLFSKNLKVYLESLDSLLDYDVFLYFPKENCEENYANEMINPDTFLTILSNPHYKLILLDTNIPSLPEGLSKKQKNSIIQWYRINKCFSFISDTYDLIIRIRPDVKILIEPLEFVSCLQNALIDKNFLHIPKGYDIDKESSNDHLAFGSYALMKEYCSLFSNLHIVSDFKSEIYLHSFLHSKNIAVKKIPLEYKLSLSDCKVIAIAGDSASGKSTLMKYIQDVLPKESSLSIETDSYHKWERNDSNWSYFTHLNPNANNLERMSEDVLRLKIGNNVSLVEYDHKTGKFMQEKLTCSKPFLILCGLHVLYKQALLKDLDLKIFLNTEEYLKVDWKINRDMNERGHTLDKIIETILKRKEDSEKYILPQKNSADIIITYFLQDSVLAVKIEISNILSSIIHQFHDFFASSTSTENQSPYITYILKNDIYASSIYSKLYSLRHSLCFLPTTGFQDGTTGILQFLIFLILFYGN